MTEKVKITQVYEWVKTGHWTKKQFLDWNREQMIPHHQRYFALMEEMERMCEFTRDLQNQIATSIVVSADAFDVIGAASVLDNQEDVMLDSGEDTVQT